MKRVFSVLFIFLTVNSFAQPFPTIHTSRPRIMEDSSRFAWLRANLGAGDCALTYNTVKTNFTLYWITDPLLYQVGSDTTIWTWDWTDKWASDQTLMTAFLYKLSPDTLHKKRCMYIIDHFMMAADTVNFTTMEWYTEESLLRQMSDAGDLMLDWLYDSIPAPKRQALAQRMYRMNREFMNKYILSSAGTAYVSSHNALNCVQTMQNTIALYGADGLSALQQDTVLLWFDSLYVKWNDHLLPLYAYYRGNDGGWNWTSAYSMWSLTDQFKLFDNMLFGTTKNFYTDLSWVKNSINQYWYFIQPDNHCINWGDGGTNLTGDNVIYRHSVIYNDPRSNWLAQYYSTPAMLTWTMPYLTKLMYWNFTAPVVTKPSPPLDWWGVKSGLSVSRSSWDTGATLLWFFNSHSKRASHEHRDNNTFALFRHKPLLIDAGDYDLYGSSHFINYYTRTIAHNSICIFDSTENYFYGTTPVSNDGGQIYSPQLIGCNEVFLPQNQRGIWLRFAPGNTYSYTIADAALSYDTAKLDRFVRRIFYDKPDHIIVLDHLHLKNITTKQRDASFILHSTDQPVMSGSVINTAVPGHIITYNGRDYKVTTGGGNVAIRTLLPALTNSTLVGGTGYEYWVDGTNYPPSEVPDSIYQTPGKWRIEVRPNTVTDSLIYLHTLKVGDSANVAIAGGIGQKNNYSIGVDWDNTLYYFNAHGDTTCDYHILNNIPGSRSLSIIACDLKRSTSYDVKLNVVVATTASTDSNGVLRCNVNLSTGTYTVEITHDKTGVITVSNKPACYEIFPNPAKNKIFIQCKSENAEKNIAITIYNEVGVKVTEKNVVTKNWVSVALSPGIYYISINDDKGIETLKLEIAH
jgi:Secretion system C-terminal sorting domain/Heparinase II/III-like protein